MFAETASTSSRCLSHTITVSEDFEVSPFRNGTVAINGDVETGVFNEQFIGFGRDFGTFANTMTADAYDESVRTRFIMQIQACGTGAQLIMPA